MSTQVPGALQGATEDDARLLSWVMAGAGDFNDLVKRAFNSKVRLVILTDEGTP